MYRTCSCILWGNARCVIEFVCDKIGCQSSNSMMSDTRFGTKGSGNSPPEHIRHVPHDSPPRFSCTDFCLGKANMRQNGWQPGEQDPAVVQGTGGRYREGMNCVLRRFLGDGRPSLRVWKSLVI